MSSDETDTSVSEEQQNTDANRKRKRESDVHIKNENIGEFDASTTDDDAERETRQKENDETYFAKPARTTNPERCKTFRERKKFLQSTQKPATKTKAEIKSIIVNINGMTKSEKRAEYNRRYWLRKKYNLKKPAAMTAAERQRLYRERKKISQSVQLEEITEATQTLSSSLLNSPEYELNKKKLRAAEYMRKYRERMKIEFIKMRSGPKTDRERDIVYECDSKKKLERAAGLEDTERSPKKRAKTTAEGMREYKEYKKLLELSRKYAVELPPILNITKKSGDSSNPAAPIEAPTIKTKDATLGIGFDIKEEPIDFNIDAANENNCDVEQRYIINSTSISNTGFTFVNVGPSDFPAYDPVDNDAGKRTSEKSTQTEEKTHDNKCVQANPDMCDKTFQTLKLEEDKCV